MTNTTKADPGDRDEWDHWVIHAARYDRELAPFARLLLDRADIQTDDTVLDIGCGCGATTLDAARIGGHAVGVDVSAPGHGWSGPQRRTDRPSTGRVWFRTSEPPRPNPTAR